MASQLNFVLCPLMAQGHMIPMIDIARILASHGVYVTIITTPYNASRSASALRRSGSRVRLAEVQFPYGEVAGLPEGCENLDMVPDLASSLSFFTASNTLQDQVEQILQDLTPPPSCIISDMSLPYTAKVAIKFNIPRISFLGQSCFTLLCLHNLGVTKVLRNMASENEHFVLPCIPHRIEMTKAQIPGQQGKGGSRGEGWREFYAKTAEAEGSTYGVVMNSFEELEPEYAKGYKDAKKGKVWCIGPVSLSNKDELDKSERGNKASIDEHHCMNWLDLKEPKSVIYACLGSISNLTTLQMVELGLALEASNKPFIWVIREGNHSEELKNWFKEDGFEERNRGKGLVIKGWAPQVLILSHFAIGGFLTHCGWNSTLEAVCAGVPMVTWPMFGDQFFNEKLIVEILRIGVSVGAESPVEKGVLVKKDSFERAIEELMDETRERVRGLGEMAKLAVEEGGSSYSNVKLLIQDIMMQQTKRDT